MRTRIKTKIIRSEMVSSPDPDRQVLLAETHRLEQQGHVLRRPELRRKASEIFIASPKGYDANLTVGEGTL
jgi:hypothetical protein